MRQQSHISYTAARTRRSVKQTVSQATGISITPLRGFFLTLLFLGVPTVSLGAMCLALVQNNLRLSEQNTELQTIASEVKAEVDSLGAEIETLRERAGVPKESTREQARGQAREQASSSSAASTASRQNRWPVSTHGNSLSETDVLTNVFPPRGGPASAVDPVNLLKDAQAQVPKLNQTLDTRIKPALEEALAAEAAYPDGQPVVGQVEISSEFGIRSNPFGGSGYETHEGIDFVGEYGDIIAAAGDGTVTLAGPNGGYGNAVTIEHGGGYKTLYGHMSEVNVKTGDTVERGQIIGRIGSTGRSSGPHLHYSLYKDGTAINPRTLLKLPAKQPK